LGSKQATLLSTINNLINSRSDFERWLQLSSDFQRSQASENCSAATLLSENATSVTNGLDRRAAEKSIDAVILVARKLTPNHSRMSQFNTKNKICNKFNNQCTLV
jgi:hypothetical protein